MNFGLRKLSLSQNAVKTGPMRGEAVTESTSQTLASDECKSSSGFRYRKLKTHRTESQAQTQGTTHLRQGSAAVPGKQVWVVLSLCGRPRPCASPSQFHLFDVKAILTLGPLQQFSWISVSLGLKKTLSTAGNGLN